MFVKLVICYSIYFVSFCSVANTEEELLPVHRTFLQELLNSRDELVKVKHELQLKKDEESKLVALRQELQHLKNQLINKVQHPELIVSDNTKTEMLKEMADIGTELIRFGLKKKSKILMILQAIKKFLLSISSKGAKKALAAAVAPVLQPAA